MKDKIDLIVLALILAAVSCFIQIRTTAQDMTEAGRWRRDLTLLDQRTNTLGSGQAVLEGEQATMNFSEAMLATNRPVLKLGGPNVAPGTCLIRSPCRVVFKSARTGQKVRYSPKSNTFSGGVKMEVFMQEHPAFDLTADEVKVEH